jgi:hypothetical protein
LPLFRCGKMLEGIPETHCSEHTPNLSFRSSREKLRDSNYLDGPVGAHARCSLSAACGGN